MNTADDSPGDDVLLERALAGDEDSFGLIFDRHHDRIYRHALRLVPNAGTAEDVVAMVFLEAWRRRAFITRTGDTILPWLLVTTNNITRNIKRAERRYALFLARLPEPAQEVDPALAVVQQIETAEQRKALHEAFSRLNQKDQDILTLCVLEELSTSKAGSVLGIPQGTVKSRLSRAKSRLASLVPHLAVTTEFSNEGSLR